MYVSKTIRSNVDRQKVIQNEVKCTSENIDLHICKSIERLSSWMKWMNNKYFSFNSLIHWIVFFFENCTNKFVTSKQVVTVVTTTAIAMLIFFFLFLFFCFKCHFVIAIQVLCPCLHYTNFFLSQFRIVVQNEYNTRYVNWKQAPNWMKLE